MKKFALALALIALATPILAGPIAPVTNTGTNRFSWTFRETEPCYIERLDVRCSGVNTITVTVVNFAAVTNTIASSTNGVLDYTAADSLFRVIQGGAVSIGFTSALTTNTTVIYPVKK